MKALKIILISLFSLLILGGGGLFLAGYLSPKPGGLRIETTPKALVYINGNLVGETPYQGTYKAEKIVLRLVPKETSQTLVSYETPITLVSGVETVIGRIFSGSESGSSGYVISFEKTKTETAGFIATSWPDNAQVLIDGVSRGFSPYSVTNIAPAMHTIGIKSPGYSDFSISVKTLIGYKLTVYAKLAKGTTSTSNSDESAKKEVKEVTILNTPTGYLRVRSLPGKNGEEIAQVSPGEVFPYLDTDAVTGWIEIQYQASKSGMPLGIVGWVSGEYATVSSTFK